MSKPVKRKNKLQQKNAAMAGNQIRLTIPDLVILSLLSERSMHGYDVNSTLEERKIRDWALLQLKREAHGQAGLPA